MRGRGAGTVLQQMTFCFVHQPSTCLKDIQQLLGVDPKGSDFWSHTQIAECCGQALLLSRLAHSLTNLHALFTRTRLLGRLGRCFGVCLFDGSPQVLLLACFSLSLILPLLFLCFRSFRCLIRLGRFSLCLGHLGFRLGSGFGFGFCKCFRLCRCLRETFGFCFGHWQGVSLFHNLLLFRLADLCCSPTLASRLFDRRLRVCLLGLR
mmetsp:Transcript_46003/g.85824  ORF Transcript_46003/g.85824 Transcript_46003/m.85824 type:complete len:207 (+) Transcript_46003:191-811(+)